MELKEIRERLMLTQAELGDILGVTAETVRRWEMGRGEPNKIYKDYIKKYYNRHIKDIEMRPETIKAIRKSNNLTQQEFADALGVGQGTVADWESGRHPPRQVAQKKIYQFYKTHR